ncbi:MAG: acyl-CoA dehydrogenase family protein [Parahaliea sp.]
MIGVTDFRSGSDLNAFAGLRAEVRDFLAATLHDLPPRKRALSWSGCDEDFSRKLGERGWIGMTWPARYGGAERSALERFVVVEELLAAGAPVMAHWFADRQFGPLLLKFGTEEQRQAILPQIVRGSCYISIGLSEPNAGSDLASVQTRAREVAGGYRLSGTKLWTSLANRAHYMIVLCRTDDAPQDRKLGLSQLLVDMTAPGISVNPITDMTGARHFNEVVFNDVFIPHSAVIGQRGNGWSQAMSELAHERSGAERYMSSLVLVNQLAERVRRCPSAEGFGELGRIAAHLAVLRRMSFVVAGMLESGEEPGLQAALVKDLGAVFEQEIPAIARRLFDVEPALDADDEYAATLAFTLLQAPSFSLRGGTREILRGIIARGVGLR